MFCNKCGNYLEDDAKFCNKCGKKANELYTEKGLCSECYKEYVVHKQKSRRNIGIIICLIIVVCLMFLFNTNYLTNILNTSVKQMDKGKKLQNSASIADSSKDSLIVDSLSKQYKK